MNLKGAFVFHLLELSDALTKEEIDEIRKSTGSAKRTYPIKTENLVLREFIITDVQGLVAANLSGTTKDAQRLAIEIIQDAGNSVRKRMELAILLAENEKRMIGRVGFRVIGKGSETADGEMIKVVDQTLNDLSKGEELAILYIFIDPQLKDRGPLDEALNAFLPVSAKIMGHGLTARSNMIENRKVMRLDGDLIAGSEIYRVLIDE